MGFGRQAPGLAVTAAQRDKVKASLEAVICFNLDQPLTVDVALKPLHEALRALGTLARQMKEQLRAAAESVVKELRLSERPDGTQATALLDAAGVDLADLAQPFTALSTAWSQLKGAILTAIRVAHPQGVACGQQEIETAIAQGKIPEAKEQFSKAATTRFGSGWAWLSVDKGKLVIESTANQDSPISEGRTPILGLDVWEHAYYLNYQNRRPDYINAFYNVINWNEVAKRLAAAK